MAGTCEVRGASYPVIDFGQICSAPDQAPDGWDDPVIAREPGPIGLWRLDTTRNILKWSDETYAIFGVEKGAPQTYETFLHAVHPDDRAYVHEKWTAALNGEPYDIEHRILANGRMRWVREKACLEFDENGALLGGFGIVQDVTNRKQADKALQWNAGRNELLSNAATRLLCCSDIPSAVEELCHDAMRFLDCEVFLNFIADAETGRLNLASCAGISASAADAAQPSDLGARVCACVAHDGKRIVLERISTQGDARAQFVPSCGVDAYCCHPLISKGRVIGALSFGSRSRPGFSRSDLEVMEAVSQLVSLAMERLIMEQALEDADRRKDEFLATLAHELRNPLAPIHNGLQILKRRGGEDPTRIRQMMERQVDHIVRLVDDLLDVARITNGKIALRKERSDFVAIVEQAVEATRQAFDKSRIRLRVKAPGQPLYVVGDPVRLTQVAVNLLDNAAKYTDAGGSVDIDVTRSGGNAVLTVTDTGVGIPPEMLPRVFDLFSQVDRTLDRAQGGLGVGLALAREIVALHEGEVHAQSDGTGLGSRFIVRLPTAPMTAKAIDEVLRTPATPRTPYRAGRRRSEAWAKPCAARSSAHTA